MEPDADQFLAAHLSKLRGVSCVLPIGRARSGRRGAAPCERGLVDGPERLVREFGVGRMSGGGLAAGVPANRTRFGALHADGRGG